MMMLTPDIQILILTEFQTLVRKSKGQKAVSSQMVISNPQASLIIIGKNHPSHHVIMIVTLILVIVGDHQIPALILGKMRVKSLLLKDFKI